MSQNSNEPRESLAPRVRESNAAGEAALTVTQRRASAQQPGLFPGRSSRPVVRPVVVMTAGRTEYAARCPGCRDWHRHVSLGTKHAPCGATYRLEPKAKLKGATP